MVLLARGSAGAYVSQSAYDGSYNDQSGPVWLKLTVNSVTVGGAAQDQYTAFASLDGTTWGQIGQVTLAAGALGAAPLACVAADANGSTFDGSTAASTATFAHVSLGAVTTTASAATPEVPYNVRAEAFSGSDGRVVWQPLVGADTVTVQRSSDGGATYADVVTVPATDDTFLPTGLLPNTTYLYRLVAANANGAGPASPGVSFTTTAKLLHGTYSPSVGTPGGPDAMAITESSVPTLADSPQQAILLAGGGSTTSSVDGLTYAFGGFASVAGGYAGDSFGTFVDAAAGSTPASVTLNNTAGQLDAPAAQHDGNTPTPTPTPTTTPPCDCPLCCGATSKHPVKYGDGTPVFTIGDLTAGGFTGGWSVIRNYTTQADLLPDNSFGYGWTNNRQTFLISDGGGDGGANPDVVVVNTAYKQVAFDYAGGGYGQATKVSNDTLSRDAAAGTYAWSNPETGDVSVYYDFGPATAANLQGKVKYTLDAAGNRVDFAYNGAGQLTTVSQADAAGDAEAFAYTYFAAGPNAGQVSNVRQTLRRAGASSPTLYRQAVYGYYQGTYAGGDAYGNQGDLRSVVLEDGSGHALATSYYRYYTPADIAAGQPGYVGALKYVLTPTGYAKLAAAVGDPFTATDAQAAAYADNYFQYDAGERVTEEVAGAAGASTAGGLGTDTLAYHQNPAYPSTGGAADYNQWLMRTTEVTPDGTTNVVYTNENEDVLLTITTSGSVTEVTANRYDSFGRLIATLAPSAMDSSYYAPSNAGTFEALSDLGIAEGGAFAHAGLVTTTAYYTSTTATAAAAGGAEGFTSAEYVQHGLSGTPVQQAGYAYLASTDAAGRTTFHAAGTTQYRNADGTGAETTTAADTFYSGTNTIYAQAVTAPAVTAAEDGPGTAAVVQTVYDTYGHAVWTRDARGFIGYAGYDIATGAVVQSIADVNTASLGDLVDDAVPLPSGWATPAGGGLNLVTAYTVDDLGRTTEEVTPNGNVTYTVYDDPDHAVRVYAGWNALTGTTTGPTEVYREDWAGGYAETLTMSAVPAVSGAAGSYVPTGTEAIAGLQSLSRSLTDATGQVVEVDDYFNLAGLTYSTVPYLGTAGTNYYVTTAAYDAGGRQYQTTDANGTITQTLYDGFNNALSRSVGTSASNLTDVADLTYDADNNLITETDHPGGGQADRLTAYAYDFRDRPILETAGAGTAAAIVTATAYDNLDEATETRTYAGSGFTVSADGTPTSADAALLRSDVTTAYDERGQVYQTSVFGVNPITGTETGDSQVTSDYHDLGGDLIAERAATGLWTKTLYDGAGRVTSAYQTDGSGGTAYAAAASVAGDVVLSQTAYTYDGDGNTIGTVTADRLPGDAPTATGVLGGSGPAARVSYTSMFYDPADRPVTSIDYGTNAPTAAYTGVLTAGTVTGGVTVVTDPSRAGMASAVGDVLILTAGTGAGLRATVTGDDGNGDLTLSAQLSVTPGLGSGYALVAPGGLVSQTNYAPSGWVANTFDANDLDTGYNHDGLGRTTETIADYTGGTPTDNTDQTTDYTYDGVGDVTRMTAVMPTGTPSQTTEYVYGVGPSTGSGIYSNDLPQATQYPDPATGAASAGQAETYSYDALGEETTYTDRNGTTHAYAYDALGRLTTDAVTAFGTGVDTSVAQIGYTYTDQGQRAMATSYDGSGTVVNQTRDSYDAFGNLAGEAQAVTGAVAVGTPTVGYTTDPTTGRMTSMTYPNGRTLTYNYATGLDGNISRLTSISDGSGTIQSYGYQGLATPLAATNGNGVTQTRTLDALGRVATNTYTDASGTTIDGQQYTYDPNSNVLSRRNLVLPGQSELYTYDGLNRLTTFARGALNGDGTAISGAPTGTESWNYDSVGNWKGNTLNGTTTSRTNNAQNQVNTVGTATLAYDANGNTLTDNNGQQYVYDAWNRVVTVKNAAGTTIAAYTYDAQNRRVTETHGTTITALYYSKNWQVIEEREGGVTTKQYVWSPFYVDGLVERDDHDPTTGGTALNRRLYAQQDANYNTTSLTDASGTVVERYAYDPYGAVTVLNPDGTVRGDGSASASGYGMVNLYEGMRFDPVTGLYYARNRQGYDPSEGRFIQPDPTGGAYVNGADLYQFDLSSPLVYADPSGLGAMPLPSTPPAGPQPVSPLPEGPYPMPNVNPAPGAGGAAAGEEAAVGEGFAADGAFSGMFVYIVAPAAAVAGYLKLGSSCYYLGETIGLGNDASVPSRQYLGMPPAPSGTYYGRDAADRYYQSLQQGTGAVAQNGAGQQPGAVPGAPSQPSTTQPTVPLPIARQKQDGHVPGTAANNLRNNQGKPTSTWNPGEDHDALTQEAWQKGTCTTDPKIRTWDAGRPIGTGMNGGSQSQIRVSKDGQGRIHGTPYGPEQ